MKCGIDEIHKLVQDSLEEKVSRESFDKTLQHLIDNDSVKPNSVSNRACLSIPKNNTRRDAFDIKQEIQSFKNELIEEEFNRLTQAFFVEINSLKSNVLTTDAPKDMNSCYVSFLREEIEYLKKENRALIIKQLPEIKTTVNPTSNLVTCNEISTDTTTQNSNSVIGKAIQNQNQELLKKEIKKTKKKGNKNINEKNACTNGKNTLEANENKNQKKIKEDNCNRITNK